MVLKCKVSYTFSGQAALNDNGIRPPSFYGRKGGVELLIRSTYHNWLNLNTRNAPRKLNLIKN